jgi:hypothetical protein
MSARDLEADAPGVEADLNYLVPGSRVNRRYVAPGAEFNTGQYAPQRVKIRNARPFQNRLKLDSHGFVLAEHVSEVADFTDKAQVDERYTREVIDVVRRVTGAARVLPMGWMARTSGQLPAPSQQAAAYTHQGGLQPPASDVHVDMAPDRAHRFAKMLYDKHVPDGLGYSRFVATSCWRAFSAPPQDWPLAVCDGSSVDADEGVKNTMIIVDARPAPDAIPPELPNEDTLPAASVFHFNPMHRWWYFPNMTRNEVLVLKFHDSDRSTAWRTPHTSFHDPTYPNAGVRRSIEFRTVAYFD